MVKSAKQLRKEATISQLKGFLAYWELVRDTKHFTIFSERYVNARITRIEKGLSQLGG
jgi:hypothetical protein